MLAQQNLSYIALGVREGLTVKLAKAHGDTELIRIVCSSALFWAWCVGTLILCSAFILVFIAGMGDIHWVWGAILAYLSVTNEMLINISRDRNKILKVALIDLVFNAVPLGAALIFMHSITVTIVLMALVGGYLMSILLYSSETREYRWEKVSGRAVRELLMIGVQLALVSFVTTSITSVFVFSASAMKLGKSVGLLVFGNSLCTIVLFGLNMIAWAMTSKAMKSIRGDAGLPGQGDVRGETLRAIFRLGIVLSASSILCLRIVFLYTMREYAGSEVFAVYLCLLQAYALLLYRELNFLAIRSQSLWIAGGYGIVLLATVAIAVITSKIPIVLLMQIALGLMCLLSLCCVYYCRRLQFVDRNRKSQMVVLCFPFAFGGCYALLGTGGALVLAAVSVGALLKVHRPELRALRLHSVIG